MYSQIASNKRKTYIIMFFFIVLIFAIGLLFSKIYSNNYTIFYFVAGFSLIYTLIAYHSGTKLSLSLNGAQEIKKADNPRLWKIIENLSITDGLPMPRVFIINDPAPNAFATGKSPDKAAVCATTGLLEIMNDDELQGVFAHEMGHVKNYDIRVAMVAFALTAAISILADIFIRISFFGGDRRSNGQSNYVFLLIGIAAAILAPIVATLIELAVTRKREYLADATGALTTRYPEGLISALQKIKKTGSAMKKQNTATAHFFFANPLKNHGITNLFSTHPPIDERIKRLQDMGSNA